MLQIVVVDGGGVNLFLFVAKKKNIYLFSYN
jgi:hypothetical protein